MIITNIKIRSLTGRIAAELDRSNVKLGQRHRVPKDIILGYDAPFTKIREPELNPDGTITKKMDFIYIETDEGVTGVAGPLDSFFADQGGAGDLAPFLNCIKGEDPFNTERIWELMYRTVVKIGFRELRMMSAVDIALWDIKCRACSLPLHKLLGGKTQTVLPVYASSVGVGYQEGNYDLDKVAQYVKKINAEGYVGSKWWIHRGPSDGEKGVRDMEALVRTIREAGGEDHKIMIDCWCGWTYEYAMRVCERIADYDIFFLEEVLLPSQINQIAKLSQNCPVRLALGEHLTTKYDYLRHIEAGYDGLFQPDPYWMGGISEFNKVMGLLTSYDFPVALHGICPPLCIQLASVYPLSVSIISEYLVELMDAQQFFLKYPAKPVNGLFTVPDTVGCGLDVDENKIYEEKWSVL